MPPRNIHAPLQKVIENSEGEGEPVNLNSLQKRIKLKWDFKGGGGYKPKKASSMGGYGYFLDPHSADYNADIIYGHTSNGLLLLML